MSDVRDVFPRSGDTGRVIRAFVRGERVKLDRATTDTHVTAVFSKVDNPRGRPVGRLDMANVGGSVVYWSDQHGLVADLRNNSGYRRVRARLVADYVAELVGVDPTALVFDGRDQTTILGPLGWRAWVAAVRAEQAA